MPAKKRNPTRGSAGLRGNDLAREADRREGTKPPIGSLAAKYCARRQRLIQHIYEAGPRAVMEALLAVEAGNSLDDVLADFARIPAHIYRGVGASEMLPRRSLRD